MSCFVKLTVFNKKTLMHKVYTVIAGFADDIGMAINNDATSISNVFKDYDLFSSLSGIELNLDKTEILKMNVNTLHSDFRPIQLVVDNARIDTVESLTICGICFSNNSNISYGKNVLDKIVKMERQLIRWLQRPLSMEGKILIVKTFGLSQLIYSLQMCEILESELVDLERMIFKFLWNRKWVGSIAPDRIKRATLKLSYEQGGMQAPDIVLLNKALKVKQFLRSMRTNHPINLIQKFQLERDGYDDYFKTEYAKTCKYDPVIKMYQIVCNSLTDQFRSHCNTLPLPDTNSLQNVVSIIASTDVLEFLMRKKELLLINRFGALSNVGVVSYKELFNESIFPRNDRLGELAKYILKFFPIAWKVAVESVTNYESDLTYDNEFPTRDLQLCRHELITVKNLRYALNEMAIVPPHPYTDFQKFQLLNVNNVNPFKIVRKFIHMPRDKFFKYRILQGDIFCNSRMFKFKMVNSPLCSYCSATQEVETIKHLLWGCPRSQSVWEYLKLLVLQTNNVDYINYEAIIVGSERTIPIVESLIVLVLKMIMVKERNTSITHEQVKNKIKAQFIIEQNSMRNNKNIFDRRWSALEQTLFGIHV